MELDISIFGLVFSVFLSVFVTSNFVTKIVAKTEILVREVSGWNLVHEAKNAFSISNSDRIEPESLIRDHSEFVRSIECNITLFTWDFAFVAILYAFIEFDAIGLTTADAISAVLYLVAFPYLFLLFWRISDRFFGGREESFLSTNRIKNRRTTRRYPMLFFVSIIVYFLSFQFWNLIFVAIAPVVLAAVSLFIFSFFSVIIYRIVIIEKFESLEGIEDKAARIYERHELHRLNWVAEVAALFLTVVLLITISQYFLPKVNMHELFLIGPFIQNYIIFYISLVPLFVLVWRYCAELFVPFMRFLFWGMFRGK